MGHQDYGPRSSWIRHLVREVDSFHYVEAGGSVGESHWSLPRLLLEAHYDLLDQLRRLVLSVNWSEWRQDQIFRVENVGNDASPF